MSQVPGSTRMLSCLVFNYHHQFIVNTSSYTEKHSHPPPPPPPPPPWSGHLHHRGRGETHCWHGHVWCLVKSIAPPTVNFKVNKCFMFSLYSMKKIKNGLSYNNANTLDEYMIYSLNKTTR